MIVATGAADEEVVDATDSKAEREEVAALLVFGCDDDCKPKENPVPDGFTAADAAAVPKLNVWDDCPKGMDDPGVEIELAGAVPKSEGFEVAFPNE